MKNPNRPPTRCPICKSKIKPIKQSWYIDYGRDYGRDNIELFKYECVDDPNKIAHYRYEPSILRYSNYSGIWNETCEVLYIEDYRIVITIDKYYIHKKNKNKWVECENNFKIKTQCIVNKIKKLISSKY